MDSNENRTIEAGTEPLLTPEELAAYLKVARGTVYNWVTRDTIPFVKVGTALRFRRSEVDEWMVEHRKRNGAGKST